MESFRGAVENEVIPSRAKFQSLPIVPFRLTSNPRVAVVRDGILRVANPGKQTLHEAMLLT